MKVKDKLNILIVDDDLDIGWMLKMVLEHKGYQVTLMNRADEVEIINMQPPIDLLILDMLICGVKGTDICRSIKGQQLYPNIPILMISALPDARKICIDAEADEFISKPFEINTILDTIQRLITNNRINDLRPVEKEDNILS